MDGVGSRLSDSPGLMTPPLLHRLIALALCAAAVAGAGSPAGAFEPRAKVFRLPAEPVEEAVLRFALQGDVSVGWSGRSACQGLSRPVLGALAPADALARLLPPGCGFEQLGARTFRVFARRTKPERPPAGAPTLAPVAPAPGSPPAVEELVVTAEKRSEPLIGSPFPISALSGSELARLGGDTFQEVASQMVSVAVTNLGPGRDKIFVRGLSDGSFTGVTQSTVGLYLDEAPITYNAPDPALRLADVERIEVLRGPQGSLYGSGSIGGIIRIVTAKPDPTRFSGSVAVEGALAEHGAGSAAAQAVLNAPIGSGGAAARLVAYDETLGGYIDNPRLGLRDVNRSRRTGGRLSLAAPLGDWRFLLTAAHQEIDNIDSQYTSDAHSLSRDTQLREPHDNEISIVSLTASRPTRWGDIRLTAAHVDHALHTRYDASGAFGTSGPAAFDERQRVHMMLAQAEFASNAAGRAHWLAGVFASATSEPQGATLQVLQPPQAALSVYHRDDNLAEAAAYGEFGYDLTPRLTLTLGGRLFGSWLRTKVSDFQLAPTVAARSSDLRDTGFAPKLRLSYAAAPDRVIYLQAQEGYRTGGFNLPLGVVGMGPGETYRRLFRPDRLWSYELGGELPLFSRRLTVRAALFYTRWRNVQTDQYLDSGLPISVNIGDGSNTGLELETVWRPGAHWQIRANGLVEDPGITRSARVFPARPDIGLPGVPRGMGGADVRYRWTLAAGMEAAVSAQYAYVGQSFLTFEGGPASEMGGYGVGRLAADLAAREWRVQLYLDNALDARGNTFAFGNPFSKAPQATPLRPRTLGVRVERTF